MILENREYEDRIILSDLSEDLARELFGAPLPEALRERLSSEKAWLDYPEDAAAVMTAFLVGEELRERGIPCSLGGNSAGSVLLNLLIGENLLKDSRFLRALLEEKEEFLPVRLAVPHDSLDDICDTLENYVGISPVRNADGSLQFRRADRHVIGKLLIYESDALTALWEMALYSGVGLSDIPLNDREAWEHIGDSHGLVPDVGRCPAVQFINSSLEAYRLAYFRVHHPELYFETVSNAHDI